MGLALVLGTVELAALRVRQVEGRAPLPPTFGNGPVARAAVPAVGPGDPFSFAVVGDTKSHGTFERIAERLREEPLSFVVLLGDVARDATEAEHEYVAAEADELGLPFPVFLVPGNHDVDPGRFDLDEWETRYGPSNWWLEHGGHLFLFLRVLPEPASNAETLDFARRILDGERERHRRAFVFLHLPPPVSPHVYAKPFHGRQALIALLERYRVDYVLAGDHHGLARTQRHGVSYLVSGGGGAHLRDEKFGRIHHALVLEVRPDGVDERLLVVDRAVDVEDVAERWAIAEIAPWVGAHRVPALAVPATLLSGGLTLRRAGRRGRHRALR